MDILIDIESHPVKLIISETNDSSRMLCTGRITLKKLSDYANKVINIINVRLTELTSGTLTSSAVDRHNRNRHNKQIKRTTPDKAAGRRLSSTHINGGRG